MLRYILNWGSIYAYSMLKRRKDLKTTHNIPCIFQLSLTRFRRQKWNLEMNTTLPRISTSMINFYQKFAKLWGKKQILLTILGKVYWLLCRTPNYKIFNIHFVWGWALCLKHAYFFPKSQPRYAYKCYAYKKNA